ncbi:MAG: terminase small subunit [Anaerolineae bacterium]|nr:terminase small subunit [Anaerolineae bacterium]
MTNKQRVFVEEYLRCWNATEAALKAGYSKRTARSTGCENLTKPNIKAEIEQAVSERAMTADEVLVRLAEQARGEYADYIDERGAIDIRRMKNTGKMHLIKSITHSRYSTKYEFYDAQAALFFLFISTGAVSQQPEPQDVINWTPDEWRKEAAARRGEVADTLAAFSDTDSDA